MGKGELALMNDINNKMINLFLDYLLLCLYINNKFQHDHDFILCKECGEITIRNTSNRA